MQKICIKKINNCVIENNKKERYFKQLNIYQNYNSCFKENNIKYTNAIIKIKCAKIINTIEGCSFEGQYLSGKKLILIGKVCIDFFINNNNANCKYCYPKDVEIPFSTFIVIPKDTCEEEDIHLEYFIEDISIANISKGKLLISITFLLEFEEEFLK